RCATRLSRQVGVFGYQYPGCSGALAGSRSRSSAPKSQRRSCYKREPGAHMGLSALLPLIVCLGVFAIPVLLSQRKISARAHDYFVSSEYTPPTAIQNASIAYALPLTTVAAMFAFGASADVW